MSSDPSFHAARAVDERRLALASRDPKVRAIHLELADRHAALADSASRGADDVAREDQQRSA